MSNNNAYILKIHCTYYTVSSAVQTCRAGEALFIYFFFVFETLVGVMLHAVLCGLCGALASVAGKVALSNNRTLETVNMLCEDNNLHSLGPNTCVGVAILFRVLAFSCMLLLNAAMVSSFLRSMEKNSSVIVTVISTAANYLLTGLAGKLAFNEALGSWWMLGSTIICVGLCFIVVSQDGIPKLRSR